MYLNWKDDQEYVALIEDLLEMDEVKRLEDYVHHNITNRLAHSISVSYRSFRLAKLFKLDACATARAALLHDLFYYKSCDKGDVGGRGHNYEHPRIALENALKLCDLNDLEQDIILKHMCGATLDIPSYAESWIVSLMDKESSMSECFEFCTKVAEDFYWRSAELTYKALVSTGLVPVRVEAYISEYFKR